MRIAVRLAYLDLADKKIRLLKFDLICITRENKSLFFIGEIHVCSKWMNPVNENKASLLSGGAKK